MKISEAFELYISRFVIPYQAKGTRTVFECAKKSIIAYKDIELKKIDLDFVLKWQTHTEASNNTIRGYTEKLRKVLKYWKANGVECLDYTLIPSPPKKTNIPEWLSSKEVQKFIGESLTKRNGRSEIGRARSAAIISVLYSTGLRVHELSKLNRSDIKNQSITIIGKGGKVRLVFFDKRSMYHLDKYLNLRDDNHPAMFVSTYGKRLSPDKIREAFRNISRYFDKEVHPHTLRHSYATNLLKNGCHLYTLKQLMGHSSIQSTQQYLHLVDKDLEDAYKKYHSF